MKTEDNKEGIMLIKCLYVFVLIYFTLALLIIYLENYLDLYDRKIGSGIPLVVSSAPSIGMYIYYKNWQLETKELARLFLYFVVAMSLIDFFVPALVYVFEYGYVEGIKNYNKNFESFSIQLLAISTVSLSVFHYLLLWVFYSLLALVYVVFTRRRKL